MQIRHAIVAAIFTVGFAVMEVVMIHEPDAIRPVRERTPAHAYGRPVKQTKEDRAQYKVNTAIKLLGQAARLGHSGAKKALKTLLSGPKKKQRKKARKGQSKTAQLILPKRQEARPEPIAEKEFGPKPAVSGIGDWHGDSKSASNIK